jgi:hypothetical protein
VPLITKSEVLDSPSLVSSLLASDKHRSAKEAGFFEAWFLCLISLRSVPDDASLKAGSVWMVVSPPSETVDLALCRIGGREVNHIHERLHVCEVEEGKRVIVVIRQEIWTTANAKHNESHPVLFLDFVRSLEASTALSQ